MRQHGDVGTPVWRQVRTFAKLGARRQALFLEALGLVVFASAAVKLLPYRATRRLYGNPNPRPIEPVWPRRDDWRVDPQVHDVSWALHAVERTTGWDRSCLARAIAGRIMLRRRGFAPTLVIGTRRAAGALAFHAWLLEHGQPVSGVRAARGFSVLAVFDGATEPGR